MNNKQMMFLSACITMGEFYSLQGAPRHPTENVNTDAGQIDFHMINHIKNSGAFHQIKWINVEDGVVELENGSRWSISRADAVRGWDRNKNLMITQNHAMISISRYALVNCDLKLAEPISLVREPTPTDKVSFVKSVDLVNDIVTLSDGKEWIIHSSDRRILSKFSENDRVVIGVNTGTDREKSPYLLIDTANNHFVRAHSHE